MAAFVSGNRPNRSIDRLVKTPPWTPNARKMPTNHMKKVIADHQTHCRVGKTAGKTREKDNTQSTRPPTHPPTDVRPAKLFVYVTNGAPNARVPELDIQKTCSQSAGRQVLHRPD